MFIFNIFTISYIHDSGDLFNGYEPITPPDLEIQFYQGM